MKTTAEILYILRDFKERYAEKYGIVKLGIFGSVARGEQNEKSDVDVCLKLNKASYFTLMDIQEELEKLLNVKVDIVTLHENMRVLFRRNIEKDAIYI